MSKARTLADFISDGSEFADGTISVAEVSGAAPLASPTFTGNVDLGDDVRIRLGNSDDLQLYHENSPNPGSYIIENGTAALNVQGTNIIFKNSDGSKRYADFNDGGAVELHYADATNGIKLSTASDGVDITGDVGATTATITGKTTTDELDLNAIAATIADTAVDIFVYDTRKDSDGGAWRKRTQHTSWYNETLNTATRGSRKEFPAVAVIVVHQLTNTGKVTIYDGDDPDMPMWMVLNSDQTALDILPAFSGTSLSCVTAMNGTMMVGNSTYDLSAVSFIEDTEYRWSTTAKYRYRGNIAQRSDGLNRTSVSSGGIASRAVNDVAMTVLPNAPIDAATGLPVPTIAVATDGGVSVIKDDGTVVDSTSSVLRHLNFSKSYDLWVSEYQFSDDVRFFEYPSYLSDNFGLSKSFLYSTIPPLNWDGNSSRYEQPTPTSVTDVGILTPLGLHRISYNKTSPNSSMVNLTASDYNTGWMNGDIKLATLSDTDDTNVTGSELVTNGTFDSNIDGWQARGNASNSWNSSGYIDIDRNGETADAGRNVAYQVISGFTVGATYTASAEVIALSNGFTLTASLSTLGSNIVEEGAEINAAGIATVTFVATATTLALGLGARGSQNATATVDNVSVRLAEEDRSVNGNGLQVFGTVTKSAVATGADLVAYSGFSTSNHLQQPHNSDLNFGTGDFSYMFWVKGSASANETIIDHSGSSNSVGNPRLRIHGFNASTGIIRVYIADGSVTNLELSSSAAVLNDVWNCVCVVRNSGTVSIYVNGKLDVSNGYAGNLTRTAGQLSVGLDGDNTDPLANGYLALLRISATAPSPEQILKIYNDEKHLFTEGAQATLYGSSDSVTALAYDTDSELLHVGTSAGRSVFQGLRRVDNTTTAVTSAISASNGLVADE